MPRRLIHGLARPVLKSMRIQDDEDDDDDAHICHHDFFVTDCTALRLGARCCLLQNLVKLQDGKIFKSPLLRIRS